VRTGEVEGPLIGYFFEPQVGIGHSLLNARHVHIVAERL
jgi:hypothetical protein